MVQLYIKNSFCFWDCFEMSTSTQKINHELINIQVAIELDKGKKIAEIAEKFGLKISAVKAVAKELASENQQKKNAKITASLIQNVNYWLEELRLENQ